MSRRGRAAFYEPSLVPLADMLCNTVGIIVFILIFTVLTAGGALLLKRLPYEHKTTSERVMFVCYHDRVLPLDEAGIDAELAKQVPHQKLTFSNVDGFAEAMNKCKVENQYFTLTPHAEVLTDNFGFYISKHLEVKFTYQPKDNVGELAAELENDNAVYRTSLRANDPKKRFIYFLVYPDGLDIFDRARTIARAQNFETGWDGSEAGQPLIFSSNGRQSTVQ